MPATARTPVVQAPPGPTSRPRIPSTAGPYPQVPSAPPVSAAPRLSPALPRAPAIPNEAAPDAPPRIVSVVVSPDSVTAGQTLIMRATTTSNVASVTARAFNNDVGLTKERIGQFELRYTIPKLPFFFHRAYSVQILARNAAGASTSRFVSVVLR